MLDVINVRSSLINATSSPVNNTADSPMEDSITLRQEARAEAEAEDDDEMLDTIHVRQETPFPVHIGPARNFNVSTILEPESRGTTWPPGATPFSRNVPSSDKSSSTPEPEEEGVESGSSDGSEAEEGNEMDQDEDLQVVKVKRVPNHFDKLPAAPTVSAGRSSSSAHMISSDPSEPEQKLPELQVPDSQPEYPIPLSSSSVTEGGGEVEGDGTAERPEVIEDSQPDPVSQASDSQAVEQDNQDTANNRDRDSDEFMESSQGL
jgi:hypothetical protein